MYTLCRIPFKITLLIDCVNSKMILSTKLIFDRPLYTFRDFKIIFINNFFLIYSLWSEFWVQVSNLEIIRQKYIFLHSIIISIHGIYPMLVLFLWSTFNGSDGDREPFHRITHCKIRCDWQLVWLLNNGNQKPKHSTDSMTFSC